MDDGAYFLTQKHFLSTIITIKKYFLKQKVYLYEVKRKI